MVELREWQEKLKDEVKGLLKERKVVFLNSPTGSGKTLFSLVVGLEAYPRVVVAVRTHNEYTPFYREAKRLGKRFAFVVGKSVACPFSSKDVDPEDIKCSSCPFKASTEVEFTLSPNELVAKLKERALVEGFCPYYSLLDSTEEAEVLVVTYPYVFVSYLKEGIDLSLKDSLLIVDEAHNLDRLSDLTERTLTLQTIERAKKEVRSSRAKEILDALEESVKPLLNPEEKYVRVQGKPNVSGEDLKVLAEELEDLREEMIKQRRVRRLWLSSVVKFLSAWLSSDFTIYSALNKLTAKSFTLLSSFRQVAEEAEGVLLMSGTMPPLSYMKKVLNIGDINPAEVDVTKRFRKGLTGTYDCLLALDVTSKFEKRQVMAEKYASYLLKVFYSAKFHVLAVFPSYQFMESVVSKLKIPAVVEGEDTTIESLATLREKSLICAVSRGKLTEGVEVTDERGRSLISDVVLVGVPYPPLDDFALDFIKATGLDEENYIRNNALIAVKQAIGRAIRGPEDHVTVWLLDKRYEDIWWRKNLNCLNPKRVRL